MLFNARISRRGMEQVEQGAFCKLPSQGVLSPTRPEKKYIDSSHALAPPGLDTVIDVRENRY
jgi:hypothetical protein